MECHELLVGHPTAFIVAELTADGVEQTLDLLIELNLGFPQAASAVVADRAMSAYEELARELGALAFAVSPLELDAICELARRHIGKKTVEPSNMYEKTWNELPWS